MDHYEILEVSPKASPEIIRAAYKNLMQRFHPDKHPGDAAIAARVLQIRQAFEVLSDSARRARYDRELGQASSRNAQPAGDAETKMPWGLILALLGIVLAASLASYLMQHQSPPKQTIAGIAPLPSSSHQQLGAIPAHKTLPLMTEREAIPLVEAGASRTFTGHILILPQLQMVVSENDYPMVAAHLKKNREAIHAQLIEALSLLRYEDLMRASGEEELKAAARETLQNAFAGLQETLPEAADAANSQPAAIVQDVRLPEPYTLR